MSNLPLQPLVWGVDEYTGEPVSNSLLHGYIVMNDGNGKFKVAYYLLSGGTYTKFATGFATIDEAKAWAWNHYNEKMQPYVKPMPTWISVDDRLPEKHTTVLVVYHAHFDDEPITEFDVCTAFFDGETFDPKDQLFYQKRNTTVTQWMPIPEFSTMQNMHKGE